MEGNSNQITRGAQNGVYFFQNRNVPTYEHTDPDIFDSIYISVCV